MFGFRKRGEPPFLSAVIAAAGSSTRMGGIDKQQAVIDDLPVVMRSIARFEECPAVVEIVLVCREEQISDYYRLVREYEMGKVVCVVGGGVHRQDSVFRGIGACSDRADFYVIHDGARPLVTGGEIARCVDAALQYGAAAVGAPVKDTIKVRDSGGFIQATPDRAALVAIQTPQIFAAPLYREAMERALREGCVYTDDCQLVERCGHRVFVSPGSYENIKITTPEDIALAQAILAYREEGMGEWATFE